MVVGGHPTQANNDVELIDLSGQDRTCRKPENYPYAEEGSLGAYFEGKAIICGGHNYPATYVPDCYYYNPEIGNWNKTSSMTEDRAYAASTVVQGQWWITGGHKDSIEDLSSTEYLPRSSTNFIPFQNLPVPRMHHSLVTMDSNRVMLIGGANPSRDTFIFDVNEHTWTDGPRLNSDRERSPAGIVTFPNGTQMITVVSGSVEQTSEFMNLDENRWHYGPDLPYHISNAASIQLENTFLIIGGQNWTSYLDSIWMFDPNTENWSQLEQKLTTVRVYTKAAFLVPDEFC